MSTDRWRLALIGGLVNYRAAKSNRRSYENWPSKSFLLAEWQVKQISVARVA